MCKISKHMNMTRETTSRYTIQWLIQKFWEKMLNSTKETHYQGENYLQSDDVLLLFLNEEGIEFLKLVLQKLEEIHLLLRHRLPLSGAVIHPPPLRIPLLVARLRLRLDELEPLLQLLVRQKLVPPFRQRLLNLVAQTLPKLHPKDKKLHPTKYKSRNWTNWNQGFLRIWIARSFWNEGKWGVWMGVIYNGNGGKRICEGYSWEYSFVRWGYLGFIPQRKPTFIVFIFAPLGKRCHVAASSTLECGLPQLIQEGVRYFRGDLYLENNTNSWLRNN